MINSIHLKRSALIKSKGRMEIPSFFNAEDLPKLYRERLDDSLSKIMIEKIREEKSDENS